MFERFNDQSRRVVVLAQEEARAFNHNYIGTEHLLLGLLREGKGTAARVLESANVTLDAARGELETIIGRGSQQPSGHIPFTARAKKSLELSLRETLQLGDGYIGTGHLLLGLTRQGDSVAAQILGKLGADPKDLSERVTRELHDHPEQHADVRTVPADPEQRITLRQPHEVQGLLDVIDERLSAIERHLRITPAAPDRLRAFDAQIAQVRREKEAAIEAQDFEKAAALRAREKQLVTERLRAMREMEAGVRQGAETGQAAETGHGAETGQATEAGAGLGRETGTDAESGQDAEAGEVVETGKVVESGEVAVDPGEITRLRARLARLEAQLREHDIDPDEPQEPPVAAG
jgi:ATP-dependent Clp protease ATP-binding subunit ClpA